LLLNEIKIALLEEYILLLNEIKIVLLEENAIKIFVEIFRYLMRYK